MVIVHIAGNYIRPHSNGRSAKCYHVIYGAMLVVFFNEQGEVDGREVMGDASTGLTLIRRFERPVFHTLLPLTPAVAFVEIILGPHLETEYSAWSPHTESADAVEYFAALQRACGFEAERQRVAARWKA
jgi:cupin fold WbuC family metalloprotein